MPTLLKSLFKSFFLAFIFFGAVQAFAGAGSLSGYASGNDAGKISFNCVANGGANCVSSGNFKVDISAGGNFSGFAWSNKVGWINFGPFVNNSATTVSVDNNGNLSGYAWGENAGWISFWCGNKVVNNCAGNGNFRTTINTTTGEFSGNAWSENYGWINFTCPGADTCTTTTWRPAGVANYTLTYTAGANGSITGATPQTVASGANGSAVTAVADTGYHFVSWSDSSTSNPRTDTNVVANITVTATFAADSSGNGNGPSFCDLNPSDPSCQAPTFCDLHPSDPSCQAPTFCDLHPNDPSCTNPSFCDLNPNDPSCVAQTFCELNPNDPSCQAPTFCELNPNDPSCQAPTFCELNPSDPSCNPPPQTCEQLGNCPVELPPVVNNIVDNIVNNIGNGVGPAVDQVFNALPPTIQKDLTAVGEEIKKVTKVVSKVVNAPATDTAVKVVTSTGVVTGVTFSLFSTLFMSPLSFSELFLIPIRLWGLLMAALGIKRRNKPWGTVYDSVTKQPLDPAYVIVQDLEGNEVATSITDLDGRYGFLIPPGRYRLVAHKTNYEFPSVKLAGKNIDEIYTDLYFSEVLEITTDNSVITKNIPMDPLKFDWNEFTKKDQKLMKFYSKRDIWITRVSDIMFYLGFGVTAAAVLVTPKLYNVATFLVYIVLYALKHTLLKPRPNGTITEKGTGTPLSFAVLHVFTPDMSREIVHKVADKTGKFYCLVPNGSYSIKIEKKNADESYTEVFTQKGIEVKNGFINTNFEIENTLQNPLPPVAPQAPVVEPPQPITPLAEPVVVTPTPTPIVAPVTPAPEPVVPPVASVPLVVIPPAPVTPPVSAPEPIPEMAKLMENQAPSEGPIPPENPPINPIPPSIQ